MTNKIKNNFLSFFRKEWILLIILTIIFSDFLGTLGMYLGLLLVPLLLKRTNFFSHFNSSFVCLIFFSISYVISLYGNDLFGKANGLIIFYLIYHCLFYVIGRYLMSKWYDQTYLILFIIIFSFAIPSVIIVISDIIKNGFINVMRLIENEKGEYLAATLHGVKFSLGISCLGLIFAPTENIIEKRYRLIFIIFGFICLICNIHLLNRTGLIIIGFVFLTILLSRIFFIGFKNNFIILFLFTILFFGFFSSSLGTKVLIGFNDRQEEQIFESVAGGRGSRWSQGIDLIINKPFGGGNFLFGKRYYSHNFWLDVGVMGGIIPFVLLVIFTLINININRLLIKKAFVFSFFYGSILLVLNIAFMLTFFVEPILEGNSQYVYAYFMFVGMTSMVNKKTSF